MRSAFEGHSAQSTSSAGSWASEDDGGARRRVVGFPEAGPERAASCTALLDRPDRPKRQSSLAQQLAIAAFEAEKPKLRAINVKAPLRGGTRRLMTLPEPSAVSRAADPSDPVYTGTGTLPSGGGGLALAAAGRRGSGSVGSVAVAIPQGLTKAWTTPEPLPEISPSLRKLLTDEGAAATSTPPARRPRAPPPPALTPRQHAASPAASSARESPGHQAAAERGALAQVTALREALAAEQAEVARLRREMAKMAQQQGASSHARSRDSAGDVAMVPMTPDAPEEAGAGDAPSPAPLMSAFEGFAGGWEPSPSH